MSYHKSIDGDNDFSRFFFLFFFYSFIQILFWYVFCYMEIILIQILIKYNVKNLITACTRLHDSDPQNWRKKTYRGETPLPHPPPLGRFATSGLVAPLPRILFSIYFLCFSWSQKSPPPLLKTCLRHCLHVKAWGNFHEVEWDPHGRQSEPDQGGGEGGHTAPESSHEKRVLISMNNHTTPKSCVCVCGGGGGGTFDIMSPLKICGGHVPPACPPPPPPHSSRLRGYLCFFPITGQFLSLENLRTLSGAFPHINIHLISRELFPVDPLSREHSCSRDII